MIRNEAAAKEIINIAVISLSAEESFFQLSVGRCESDRYGR